MEAWLINHYQGLSNEAIRYRETRLFDPSFHLYYRLPKALAYNGHD
jgi:hypothetical protein